MEIKTLDDLQRIGKYSIIRVEITGHKENLTVSDDYYSVFKMIFNDSIFVYISLSSLKEAKSMQEYIMSDDVKYCDQECLRMTFTGCDKCYKSLDHPFTEHEDEKIVINYDDEDPLYWSDKLRYLWFDEDTVFKMKIVLIENTDIPQYIFRKVTVEDAKLVEKFNLKMVALDEYYEDDLDKVSLLDTKYFIKNPQKAIKTMEDGTWWHYHLCLNDLEKKIVIPLIDLCILHIKKHRKYYSKELLTKYLIRDILKHFY